MLMLVKLLINAGNTPYSQDGSDEVLVLPW